MTTLEFAKKQSDSVSYMLQKAYEGAGDSVLDIKISEHAMTPREVAAHLGECYQAVLTETSGGKHEWGSFKPATTEWPALFEETMLLRSKAVEACEKEGGDQGAQRISDYIVTHDNYHVGQLCLARLQGDPSWDPYGIYQF